MHKARFILIMTMQSRPQRWILSSRVRSIMTLAKVSLIKKIGVNDYENTNHTNV